MDVSVIIPAFNEEVSIKTVITCVHRALTQNRIDHEIIVINDGSTDDTKKKAIENNVPIILIDHKQNFGYGYSIKSGISKAKGDWIVIIDADGTYPENEIPQLLKIALEENWDMVVGARTGEHVNIPAARKPAKFIINQLANYLTNTKIPDLNSGLRVIKKSIVEKFLYLLPDGFSFTTTITLAMLTNGYRVTYYPINYLKRKGRSKIRPIRDTLNFLQLIVRTVMYFEPLKIFLPCSFVLFLLAVMALIARFIKGGGFAITIPLLVLSSIQILAIGMLADLIDKRLKNKD